MGQFLPVALVDLDNFDSVRNWIAGPYESISGNGGERQEDEGQR
jgi:hypothetical protein